MDVDLERWTRLALDAAKAGVAELETRFANDAKVESAWGRDLKTQADRGAEAAILATLQTSGVAILSEECGGSFDFSDDAWHWIVDPLDGTMNFARKIPLSCVSIALWRGTTPVLGIVHDVQRNEQWVGNTITHEASCNGLAVGVASTSRLDQAILATGFPIGRSFARDDMLSFTARICRFKKIRMIGSAALSLAWVAGGRFDVYLEEGIRIWDVAAGLALVQAAGAAVQCTAMDGEGRVSVLAGVPAIVAQELAALAGHAQDHPS